MKGDETAKKIAKELGKLFNDMIDETPLEDLIPFYRAELRMQKKWRTHNMPGALSDEKFAALERAVDEFEAIYEAEKAEAEKMPLSWEEARRVRKLFDKAGDYEPLSDKRTEYKRAEH
ncbi:MAG: hypothetical protein WA584_11270 [Pyrinomonadaceae bacterium]